MDTLIKLISELEDHQLLSIRAHLDKEFVSRKLSFSVGDLGEELAIEYFNSTTGLPNLIKAPRGSKNVDALSRNGERVSIKTIQKAKKTGTIYPDIEDPNNQLFELLLIAKLSPAYQLESIHMFTWKDFLKVRAWDKRMNAWYIPYSLVKLSQGKQLLV
jgi:hypothetical protein